MYFGQLTHLKMTGVGSTAMQAGLPQSALQAAAEQYAFLHLLLEIIIKFVCPKHTRYIHSLDIVDYLQHKDNNAERTGGTVTSLVLLVGQDAPGYR